MNDGNSYPQWQQRTHLLLGDEKMMRLSRSHVLVVGVGGVGHGGKLLVGKSGDHGWAALSGRLTKVG